MSNDLPTRLREQIKLEIQINETFALLLPEDAPKFKLLREAADEIERLRASADRYEFLRLCLMPEGAEHLERLTNRPAPETAEELDAAIDATMREVRP